MTDVDERDRPPRDWGGGPLTYEEVDALLAMLDGLTKERRAHAVVQHPLLAAGTTVFGLPAEPGPRLRVRVALPRLPLWVLAQMPATLSGVCGG